MNADELKWLVTVSVVCHPTKCRWWRLCLNACVKAKGKHFEHV